MPVKRNIAAQAKVLMIGCGRMGSALLAGLTASTAALDIAVVDRGRQRVPGAKVAKTLEELDSFRPDIVVLATKGDQLGSFGGQLRRLLTPASIVVSIMAGIDLAALTVVLGPEVDVVRAMPNLAAVERQATTSLFAADTVPEAQRRRVEAVFALVGDVIWLEREAQINAVTAVSGSGLAYFFQMAEALTQAGCTAGLPAGLANRLARQTLKGAGALITAEGPTITELRNSVTSPGGTTAAALAVLESGQQFNRIIAQAVDAAKARAEGR